MSLSREIETYFIYANFTIENAHT
uniref:Uncharacterized protein n=1 Tax=Anguilla anguilla TaxID=7936 RepID=A0A0E9U1I4_ANGAN